MDDDPRNVVTRFVRRLLGVVVVSGVVFCFGWVLTRPLREARVQTAGQVVLRVLHWGDKEEDRIVRELIAGFEARNPDVRVIRSNTGSPAQLSTKLQTMLAAGDPPDLFYLDFTKIAEIAASDVLEDIEPFVRADREHAVADALNLDDFFAATLNAFRYDAATRRVGSGTLVGLAKDFTCVGFYYNKSLFDRAGVPYPPKSGWTWDEFIDACRRIGALPGCYGAELVTWESMVRIYLFTHGLDVTEPGWEKFRLTDPAVVAALDRLRSWFHDEERTLMSAKTQLETGQAPFLSGRIGLAGPFGRWQVPLYRTIRDFEWDFAPLPHAAGHAPSNGVLTVAWAMARGSRHKDASWRLMKYLLSVEGQRAVCETGLAIPVLQSVAGSACFTDPAAKPDSDDVFLAGARVAQPIEWPADPRFMDTLRTGFEAIFKLGRPAGPELARVQSQFERIAQFTGSRPRMAWGTIAYVAAGGAMILLGSLAVWLMRTRPGLVARREERIGWLMVSPWVLGFLAFCVFPIGMSLLLGFSRWNGMQTLDRAEFVGVDNFRELVTLDAPFRYAVWITAYYALLAVPSSQVFALLAAVLLGGERRGIGLFRAIWYLPSVLAGVGMAILWKWVFHHEHGMLNALLSHVMDHPPRWLERDVDVWGVPVFAAMNLWVIGGTMMIYLAGLKGIPRELYEAAAIDGAVGWRRLRSVTLPMLSPVIFFNTIMAVIASFQIFTQVFVMTGGGPAEKTQFYVYYLYKKAFDLGAMGYASAMAWILLVIVLGLTLMIMRGTQRFVYYESLRA